MKACFVGVCLFLLFGCQRSFVPRKTQSISPFAKATRNSLYFLATDFIASGARRFDLEKGTLDPFVLPAFSDGSLGFDFLSRSLVVLNRGAGDHLSLSNPEFSSVVRQIPLPPSSNPQDIAVLNDSEAYVSYLNSSRVDRFNLRTGVRTMDGIDLSAWSDGDSSPEATYFFSRGGSVWLALQRLNNKTYEPSGKSYLVSIDPTKDAVSRTIELHYPNPPSEIRGFRDEMYVAGTGKVGLTDPVLDGGIEKFSGEPLVSQGIVVTEESLGGNLHDFCIVRENAGFAIVGRPQTDLVLFDPSGTSAARTLLKGSDFQFSHLLVDEERNLVFVADRKRSDSGIRVFDFDGIEQEGQRIPLELPPLRLLLGP